MLGHSSVQLTLDTYSHLLPDLGLKERAAARLDALLTPKKEEDKEEVENPGQNPGQTEEEVVSQNFASWNQLGKWLRRLQGLPATA